MEIDQFMVFHFSDLLSFFIPCVIKKNLQKKSEIQVQILQFNKISLVEMMVAPSTKLYVPKGDFPIPLNQKQALMYFKSRPSMIIGTWRATSHCLNPGSV